MKDDFLTQIPDPNYPGHKTDWHQVPSWLQWFCIAAAAFSAAFDGRQIIDETASIYDFMYFRLLEASGKWYFRAL